MKHVSEILAATPLPLATCDPRVAAILSYLESHLPDYPFDPDIDAPFVEELAADFPAVDILDQIKSFRWYYDNQPLAHAKKPRLKLRRWISGAVKSREPW
jgi:hypothetical protein